MSNKTWRETNLVKFLEKYSVESLVNLVISRPNLTMKILLSPATLLQNPTGQDTVSMVQKMTVYATYKENRESG